MTRTSRAKRKHTRRVVSWVTLVLCGTVAYVLATAAPSDVGQHARPDARGAGNEQRTHSGNGASDGANAPGSASLELARPARIIGTLPQEVVVSESRVVIVSAEQNSDRPDRARAERFLLPTSGPGITELPVTLQLASGSFLIEVRERDARRFAHRPAQLSMSVGDLACARGFVFPAPGETIDLGAVRPQAPVLFVGRVVGKDGAPIADARVFLKAGSDSVIADGEDATAAVAASDRDGRFSLPVGRLAAALVIRAEGYLPRTLPWVVARDIDPGEVQTIVLERLRHAVSGRLDLRGRALAECGFAFVGRGQDGNLYSVAFTPESDGTFRCPIGPGGYRLRIRTGSMSLEAHGVQLERGDVDLGTILLDLTGRILLRDVRGALEAGDRLLIVAEAGALWSWRCEVDVRDIRPIPWSPLPMNAEIDHIDITASARLGGQRQVVQTPIPIAASPSIVELQFLPQERNRTLFRALEKGLDGSLRPLRLTRFSASEERATVSRGTDPPPHESSTTPPWSFRGTTSSVGEFQLPVGGRDRFRISFEHPAWGDNLHWRGSLDETESGSIIFGTAGAQLVLELRDEEERVLANTLVQITGEPITRGPTALARTTRESWTDGKGTAQFGSVPRGWRFRVKYRQGKEGGFQYQNGGTVVVPEGSGPVHSVRLQIPGKQIEGRALDADGLPLRGRVVALWRKRPAEEGGKLLAVTCGALTSSRGSWSFAGVPAGKYVLAVMHPFVGRIEMQSQPFEVTASGSTYEVRFPRQ